MRDVVFEGRPARRLRSDLTVVDVDGCVSVYSPATKHVLSLNETATDIWRLLALDLSADDIVAELATAYDLDPTVIRGDVERTVAEFEAEGVFEGGSERGSRVGPDVGTDEAHDVGRAPE